MKSLTFTFTKEKKTLQRLEQAASKEQF